MRLHSTWSSWALSISRDGDPTTLWSNIWPPTCWKMFCLISNEITSTQAASSSPQVRVTLSSMVQIYYSPLICPVARSSCLDPSRPQHPAVKGFAVESCIKNFSVRCLIPLASDFSVCLLGLGYENQRRPVPCSQLVISCYIFVESLYVYHLFSSATYTIPPLRSSLLLPSLLLLTVQMVK